MIDLIMLLVTLIWGSNFSIVKYALRDFPEVSFNAWRLILASAIFLVAIRIVRGRAAAGLRPPEPPLTGREWRIVIFLGILGCTPVVIAIMASIAGHDRLTPARWAGAALSFAGIYTLVGQRATVSSATFAGDAMIFGAMLCWSVYSVVAQPLLRTHAPLHTAQIKVVRTGTLGPGT